MSYAGFSFACSPGSKCSAAFQGCGTRTHTSLNSPPGWRPCSRDRPAASRLTAVTGVASRLSPSMMKWIGIRKRGRLLPLQVLRPVHVGPGDVARDVPLPSSRHEGQAPPIRHSRPRWIHPGQAPAGIHIPLTTHPVRRTFPRLCAETRRHCQDIIISVQNEPGSVLNRAGSGNHDGRDD